MAIVTKENFENVGEFGEPEISDLSSSTISTESVSESADSDVSHSHVEEQMTALGMKEIEVPPEPTFEHVEPVSPTPEITEMPKGLSDLDTHADDPYELDALVEGNPSGMVYLNTLKQYETIMRPKKPIDKLMIGRQQYALYQTILRAATSERDFTKNWQIVLSRFYTNPNNVYGQQYVFRHLERMPGSEMDVVLYNRLVNLIQKTCNPYTLEIGLKQVSIQKTLADVTSEIMRNNINQYYRRHVN